MMDCWGWADIPFEILSKGIEASWVYPITGRFWVKGLGGTPFKNACHPCRLEGMCIKIAVGCSINDRLHIESVVLNANVGRFMICDLTQMCQNEGRELFFTHLNPSAIYKNYGMNRLGTLCCTDCYIIESKVATGLYGSDANSLHLNSHKVARLAASIGC